MVNNQKFGSGKISLICFFIIAFAIGYLGILSWVTSNNIIWNNINFSKFLIDVNPFLTVIASLLLISVTWIYVKETKDIAESNKKNVEATQVMATETKRMADETSKNVRHQVILEIQKSYRSPEMGRAVRYLWNFRDEIEDSIKKRERYTQEIDKLKNNEPKKQEYIIKIFNKIEEEMLNEYEQRIEGNYFGYDKIDDFRRMASYFYQHLYDIVDVDNSLIEYVQTRFLNKNNVDTMIFILKPMEKRLVEMINRKDRIGITPDEKEITAENKLDELCKMAKH